MKNLVKTLLFATLLITAYTSTAQVEKGDVNLSAALLLNTSVGGAGSASGFFSVQSSLGYYFTDNIEAGGLVILSGSIAEGGTTTTPGFGAFANYSFISSNAMVVPFFGIQGFYQSLPSFDGFESSAIISAGANAGVKIFVKENLYVNNRLDYGLILSPAGSEGGNLSLQIGLGFVF